MTQLEAFRCHGTEFSGSEGYPCPPFCLFENAILSSCVTPLKCRQGPSRVTRGTEHLLLLRSPFAPASALWALPPSSTRWHLHSGWIIRPRSQPNTPRKPPKTAVAPHACSATGLLRRPWMEPSTINHRPNLSPSPLQTTLSCSSPETPRFVNHGRGWPFCTSQWSISGPMVFC